eukprot:60734-Rhodomonas_salina.2
MQAWMLLLLASVVCGPVSGERRELMGGSAQAQAQPDESLLKVVRAGKATQVRPRLSLFCRGFPVSVFLLAALPSCPPSASVWQRHAQRTPPLPLRSHELSPSFLPWRLSVLVLLPSSP